MNHEIHDPVLITTECGFQFGVIESIVTITDKNGDRTVFSLCVYGEDEPLAWADTEISDLPAPSAYGSYGITAAVERHPGYKWAMSESERRKNPPELPLAVESLPASINLPTT